MGNIPNIRNLLFLLLSMWLLPSNQYSPPPLLPNKALNVILVSNECLDLVPANPPFISLDSAPVL